MKVLLIHPLTPEAEEMYQEVISKRTGEDSGFDLLSINEIEIQTRSLYVGCGIVAVMLDENKNPLPFFVVPRSSINKYGLMISNSPGVVDKGYRGELKISTYILSDMRTKIEKGLSYAQIVLPSLEVFAVILTDKIPLDTIRGEKGFGSTVYGGKIKMI